MNHILLVTDNPDRWSFDIPSVTVVTARQYLTDPQIQRLRNCRVFNLCRHYRYQSAGYYVSLLAEARRHRPLPKITTLQDLKTSSIFRDIPPDLDEIVQKSLAPLQSDTFTLSIYFAQNTAKRYERLARQLFNLYPAPLLRAEFKRDTEMRWSLTNISPISGAAVPAEHQEMVEHFARDYFSRSNRRIRRRVPARFSMAILADPGDPDLPSDPKALQRFIRAAENQSIEAELITRDDYGTLAEYDALFIRSTTIVNNYTFRFSRRAQSEGIVVIDDPDSIIRCANKVFLAEAFERNHIPAPKTVIVHKDNKNLVLMQLGLPCILKQPDSSFSKGVVKVKTQEEYTTAIDALLEKSDLIIAQEYVPTEFDWRIGVIDRTPLYACRYYMAHGHWQIYDHTKKGNARFGRCDTLALADVPDEIIQTALKAANTIGDGLYGVDVKMISERPVVIEVNDNPSIESGIEDHVLKDGLYDTIMASFRRRLETIGK
ncbi:MAG: RimK family protein [Kiritimatiellae bacterium]|nr:RimK family protein [Kiritimatiellia bacterium]MDD4342429.1 RimK family protein [Kiritimatiellia bacterium]